MKTHTVWYYCTQTSFEAKLPILMCPSSHRNVLTWFYNPEMSPFYLSYVIWVSIMLKLIEIISNSGLIKRWLHLFTARQNDIQTGMRGSKGFFPSIKSHCFLFTLCWYHICTQWKLHLFCASGQQVCYNEGCEIRICRQVLLASRNGKNTDKRMIFTSEQVYSVA